MIFIDTWAWIGMADDTDQYHEAVIKQHRKLLKKNRRYVTSDYVVGEVIDYLYDATPEPQARAFIRGLLAKVDAGFLQLVHFHQNNSTSRGNSAKSTPTNPIFPLSISPAWWLCRNSRSSMSSPAMLIFVR